MGYLPIGRDWRIWDFSQMDAPVTFREKALAVMAEKRLSMAALARLAGVSYDVVRELSRRNGATRVENARRIADALGFSLDGLTETDLSDDEREILDAYRALRSDRRRAKLLHESRFLAQEEADERDEEAVASEHPTGADSSR